MYCPHNILVNNDILFIMIQCNGDYNYKSQVPKTHWFNLLRYTVTLFPSSKKYRIEVNHMAKYLVPVQNFNYKIKKNLVW